MRVARATKRAALLERFGPMIDSFAAEVIDLVIGRALEVARKHVAAEIDQAFAGLVGSPSPVVPQGTLPPASPAPSSSKRSPSCRQCGAAGHNARTCGRDVTTDDVGPRGVVAEPPPNRSSTGSRESRPRPVRDAESASDGGGDEEPPVDLEQLVLRPDGDEPDAAPLFVRAGPGCRLQRNPLRARARVTAVKSLTRVRIQTGRELHPPVPGVERPRTRAECEGLERPCPWVACKHHLYLDINPETGSIKINFPDLEPWELQHTCALDVADLGGITLDEVGKVMNLTHERIRQIEVRGLLQLRQTAGPALGGAE